MFLILPESNQLVQNILCVRCWHQRSFLLLLQDRDHLKFLDLVCVEACTQLLRPLSVFVARKLLQAWSSASELANLYTSGSISLYVSAEFIALHTICMNRCNLRTRGSDSIQSSSLFGTFYCSLFPLYFFFNTLRTCCYITDL